MPLVPSDLASLMQTELASLGAKGSNLPNFCLGVSTGIIMSIIGKTFTTSDVGTIIGVGAGIGTGIQGLLPASMKSVALSEMPTMGSNADPLMTGVMTATATYLAANATLITVDIPVFAGTGTVNIGSILVIPTEMGNNIDSQLQAVGAQGSNRTILSMAIASGVCSGILTTGTGIVVITGSPTIPTPIPGTGNGTGTIS
jgi:hypothetical protein